MYICKGYKVMRHTIHCKNVSFIYSFDLAFVELYIENLENVCKIKKIFANKSAHNCFFFDNFLQFFKN